MARRMVIRPARLTALVVSSATAVLVAGLVIGFRLIQAPALHVPAIPPGFFRDHPLAVPFSAAIVFLAQIAPLRVRVGDAEVRMMWGEAALIAACVWLPAPLVPPAVLLGVLPAHLIRSHRRPLTMAFNIGLLTLAAGVGVGVVTAISPSYRTHLGLRPIVALVTGAGVHALTALCLVALYVVMSHGGSLARTVREMISSKFPMAVGNVVVGLLIVWAQYTDGWYLLFLPPLVWLLHQFYGYRLRGDDERRTWQHFADATRRLNRLDERDAVNAGVAGALRLFPAARVELVLDGAAARPRAYAGEADGTVAVIAVQPVGTAAAVVRPLMVRHVRVGELRLYGLPTLRPRESLMLAAFGDALAAAVHDAVTHDELRTMSERTTYDAVHDPLTGLANRAALLTRGNNALRRLEAGSLVALALFDVNDFKEVNNALGHTAGDELLQVLALRLTGSLAEGDLLARLGGDEFALLITDVQDRETAIDRVRRLAEYVAVPTEVAGVVLSVEASAGLVVAPAGDVDMTELLRRSDIAMYQAKRGGQALASYDPGRDEASTDRLALLAELREALTTGDQLVLAMQPAVSLTPNGHPGHRITGVEALVRWQHPRRGRLMPDKFLPTVEQSELIGPLTLRVLDLALGTAARWRASGVDVPLSVNLSARSLLDRRLPGQVRELLAKHDVPPAGLVLEITESVVMSSLPVTDQVLAELRGIGVQLAVDDFGTGYSSLTFLTRVQVEEVKIDRAFVQRMVDSPEASAIVRTTIALARELGLRVVAEGVETAEQRTLLVRQGCTAAQGYHFYAPLSVDRTLAVLRERHDERRWREEDAG